MVHDGAPPLTAGIVLAEASSLGGWIRAAVVLAGMVLILVAARRVIDARRDTTHALAFGQQLTMIALSLVSLLAVILALPFDAETRGQVLGFLGILLSAAIALSSTTLLGNAMAGLALRAIKSFRLGDFVSVGEHFGRVTELGLIHTEIQTEDRDLTTLPNLYLAAQPVKVVRPSGTILSARVSLGYDVPRAVAREHLLAAAADVGLEEPFVSILELDDHAVHYRIAGLFRDVRRMISTRSRLRGKVLDRLHAAGVEIASPGLVNVRRIQVHQPIVPEGEPPAPEVGLAPERVIFDKADEATTLDRLREDLEKAQAELAEAKAAKEEEAIRVLEGRCERLEAGIARRLEQSEGGEERRLSPPGRAARRGRRSRRA